MRLSFNRGSVPQFGGNILWNCKSRIIRIYFVFLFSPLPQIAAYFCHNRPIYYRKDKNNDEENRGYDRVF